MKIPTLQASRTAGFTLIELMVTIIVATILITIAVPSYTSQIRRSRRTDARTALLDFAQREERYMSTHSSYTTDPTQLGYASANPTTGSGYYQLGVCLGATAIPATPAPGTLTCAGAATTGSAFIIAALAQGPQQKDTQCLNLYVDSQGNQTATSSNCWTN